MSKKWRPTKEEKEQMSKRIGKSRGTIIMQSLWLLLAVILRMARLVVFLTCYTTNRHYYDANKDHAFTIRSHQFTWCSNVHSHIESECCLLSVAFSFIAFNFHWTPVTHFVFILHSSFSVRSVALSLWVLSKHSSHSPALRLILLVTRVVFPYYGRIQIYIKSYKTISKANTNKQIANTRTHASPFVWIMHSKWDVWNKWINAVSNNKFRFRKLLKTHAQTQMYSIFCLHKGRVIQFCILRIYHRTRMWNACDFVSHCDVEDLPSILVLYIHLNFLFFACFWLATAGDNVL